MMCRSLWWIPVEERMPEDDHEKIVTCQGEDGSRSWHKAYYAGGEWHELPNGKVENVIAWGIAEPYFDAAQIRAQHAEAYQKGDAN